MSVYIKFGRAQADPQHPNGYDERLCRALLDEHLGPWPEPTDVVLHIGNWRGHASWSVAEHLAEYLPPAARVRVLAPSEQVRRDWVALIAQARVIVQDRRKNTDPNTAPLVAWPPNRNTGWEPRR